MNKTTVGIIKLQPEDFRLNITGNPVRNSRDQEYSYFSIRLGLCNQNDTPDCQINEQIRNHFTNVSEFKTFYATPEFNSDDYENPIHYVNITKLHTTNNA